MASVGHVAVGMVAGRFYEPQATPTRRAVWMALFSALSLAPDIDVVGFRLHVAYGDEWGHRGATHSLAIATIAALVIAAFSRRSSWREKVRAFAFAWVVAASHGLLDMLTNGGLGVALWWPLSNVRHFFAWRPLPVAPIGARMLSARGLHVVLVELALFAPLWLLALWPRRRLKR